MSVFGIGMVKDEADIITSTVRNMLNHVDEIIIADNGSTDGTRDLLAALPVTIIDDPEIGYYQSRKMTALAQTAGERGATWVVPFDADEIWYSRSNPRIGDMLEALAPQWLTARADLFDHVATAADPANPDPVRRIGWRREEPGRLPKVACRVRPDLVIEQGNHGASYTGGTTEFAGDLVVRHFPYRSAAQFVSKARNGAAAYAATDLPEDFGAHWRQYGALLESEGVESVEGVFRQWFWSADPKKDGLIYDPVR